MFINVSYIRVYIRWFANYFQCVFFSVQWRQCYLFSCVILNTFCNVSNRCINIVRFNWFQCDDEHVHTNGCSVGEFASLLQPDVTLGCIWRS